MAEFELQEDTPRRSGATPVLPPRAGQESQGDERAVLQGFISEIDVYYQAIKGFHEQEPDLVMQSIAAYSGRLCEIRARLQRMGSTLSNKLRTREVDPLIEELKFQYQIASRMQSVREFEFKSSGGGV